MSQRAYVLFDYLRANVYQTWWSAVLFVFVSLLYLNAGDWMNPFAESIPHVERFEHALQWDPVIGCGTEMCK